MCFTDVLQFHHNLQIPLYPYNGQGYWWLIIFATSLPTLQRLTLLMEVSICLLLADIMEENSCIWSMLSSGPAHHHSTDAIDQVAIYLNTGSCNVDDPTGRFVELHDFMLSELLYTIPIALARKIIMQNIISRCRALLSLQPVKQTEAKLLDRAIATKICDLLHFPYSPQLQILNCGISQQSQDHLCQLDLQI